jgi:CrcB protein
VTRPAESIRFARRRTAAGTPTLFAPVGSAWQRPRLGVLAAVFVGGCAGGALRYAATSAQGSSAVSFPWATFAVNVAGAFMLAVLIALVARVVQSRYLRPLLGTGFCGGLTTFSSVVVAADRMVAHDRVGLAAAYVAATVVAGLVAAAAGLLLGRVAVVLRRPVHKERSAQ